MKKTAIFLALTMPTLTQALTYDGALVSAKAQGGSNVSFTWVAPYTNTYKVQVYIDTAANATNALYRVYPKGKRADDNSCLSTDTSYPCFEIPVNQTLNQGKWLQLTLDNNPKTAWAFNKSLGGLVTINANNLAPTENLSISADGVRFVPLVINFPTTGFSKVSNSGTLVSNNSVLGTGLNNWACSHDNATGLFWEIKTDDGGLRDKDNTYSWYNSNPATNGGKAGYQSINGDAGKGVCTGNIACNTEAYVKAVNAKRLCRFNNWRLPSQDELLTLYTHIYTSSSPTIVNTYFPNTIINWHWTSSINTSVSEYAGIVNFTSGYFYNGIKDQANAVRLVRDAQ